MLLCIFDNRLPLPATRPHTTGLLLNLVAVISLQIHHVSSNLANRNRPVLRQQQSTPGGELMEPVNQPSMNQEYARYLSQYMQNIQRHDDYWAQLNLAQMNNRAQPPVRTQHHLGTSSTPIDQSALNRASFMTELAAPQSSASSIRRDDATMVRKGKVDDVLIFKDQMRHQPVKGQQHSPAKSWPLRPANFKEKLFFENCISRATKLVSTCEDHLIRRLNQDAAEGRTVLDVGRRVCCALFWHKDCISSKVVQACPDSSPLAVDYLLGSRKVDLTISCQKFNRDGCNGAQSLSVPPDGGTLILLLSYLIVLMLMRL